MKKKETTKCKLCNNPIDADIMSRVRHMANIHPLELVLYFKDKAPQINDAIANIRKKIA